MDLSLTLYDINGTGFIANDGRVGPYSEVTAFLRLGTYFARVFRWTGNAGSYTIKIIHTSPPRANEGEGNDTPATATSLPYGVMSTGHLGYSSNGTTDIDDYWKFGAPSTDSIYVQVVSDSTVDLNLTLYDSDGTSYLGQDGRPGIYSICGIKAVAGRTYYARVTRWTGTAGSYSILATRSSTLVGIREASGMMNIPTEFSLDQNYPNPFNPSTTIQYGLPESQRIRVSVYSLLGQEIAELVNTTQSPGNYRVVWNGKDHYGIDVPSGIYLIRLQTGSSQFVRKAVLVR